MATEEAIQFEPLQDPYNDLVTDGMSRQLQPVIKDSIPVAYRSVDFETRVGNKEKGYIQELQNQLFQKALEVDTLKSRLDAIEAMLLGINSTLSNHESRLDQLDGGV